MSSIKERVLLIAESKGQSKAEFFRDLGLSYANFKGIQKSSALNSDAIVSILSKHYDIDPAWLVTGEGEMYREGAASARDKTEIYAEPEEESSLIDALKLAIASQQKTIQSLEKQIHILEEELRRHRNEQ